VGMTLGSVGVAATARLGQRLTSKITLNKMVALAESSGAVDAKHPDRAADGLAVAGGVEELMERVESRLGLPLDFPDVGAAYGTRLAGRLITNDTPDQVYAAARVRAAIRATLAERTSPLSVVEIGGGYGGMAYWLMRMAGLRYAIVDLPVVNVLQGYFLSQALGHAEVSLYGEERGTVALVPTHALESVAVPFDVLVNKDSMPEMPREAIVEYLEWARTCCTGIFYSCNHESRVPFDGAPQNVVPEVLASVGGFELVGRDISWLRRGYVEEVYVACR
jgi:hypothetical protein